MSLLWFYSYKIFIMKSAIYTLLIATLAKPDAVSAVNGGPHGPGGMGSPFE
jgi:hypothetical protein